MSLVEVQDSPGRVVLAVLALLAILAGFIGMSSMLSVTIWSVIIIGVALAIYYFAVRFDRKGRGVNK